MDKSIENSYIYAYIEEEIKLIYFSRCNTGIFEKNRHIYDNLEILRYENFREI